MFFYCFIFKGVRAGIMYLQHSVSHHKYSYYVNTPRIVCAYIFYFAIGHYPKSIFNTILYRPTVHFNKIYRFANFGKQKRILLIVFDFRGEYRFFSAKRKLKALCLVLDVRRIVRPSNVLSLELVTISKSDYLSFVIVRAGIREIISADLFPYDHCVQ